MTDKPKSDLTIHEQSLARLRDPSGSGLKRAFVHGLSSLGTVQVTDVHIDDSPDWTGRGWGVVATVTLSDGGESRDVTLQLPWLLDAEAARLAKADGLALRIGNFRGTFWGRFHDSADGWRGRFRQPLVTYAWRPGIHKIAPPASSSASPRALVVGDFGTAWQLRLDRLNKKDRARLARWKADDPDRLISEGLDPDGLEQQSAVDVVRIRSRYASLAPDERNWYRLSALLDGPESSELMRLHRALTDRARFADDGTLSIDALRGVVSWLAAVRPVPNGQDPSSRVSALGDARAAMHRDHWHERGLGDVLTSAVAGAVATAAQRIAETTVDEDLSHVATRLRTAAQTAIDQVALGRGDFSAGVVGERPINTLARLEASRQRTFIGFGGLETYQGRLDLRTLPTGWHGTLCPLQTQESADIGLIRHSALGAWEGPYPRTVTGFADGRSPDPSDLVARYADLSVAAALIPFIGHDDPTRAALGSKMLKQAVVLDEPQAALIRTGIEALVGEVGATRATRAGACSDPDLDIGVVDIDGADVPIGYQASPPTLPGDAWKAVAREGAVREDDLLAAAPDVVDEDGQPVLAYGVNATVAFLAWKGLNYEDGIVVSTSFAERMSSTHVVRLTTGYDPWQGAEELLSEAEAAGPVAKGTAILRVLGSPARELLMPEDGYLVPVDDDGYRYSQRSGANDFQQEVRIAYRVTRPLRVGDKLTTRHGGKGVVTRIESDGMPRIQLPGGGERDVEVLLNPLGVFRRLNMGTLMELAAGLELVLREADGWATRAHRVVPRMLGAADRLALARQLQELRAPGGKLVLKNSSGERVGPEDGVMVGPLYLVKLDHLSTQKGGSRDDAPASPVTFQPVKAATWSHDRRRTAPQRIGEMEIWSLEAVGATKTLDDLLAQRGVGARELRADHHPVPADQRLLPAGIRAALGYLAVAGVRFISTDDVPAAVAERDITLDPTIGSPDEVVRAIWRGGELGAGLKDVISTFADPARDALANEMGKSKTGKAQATPGYAALARRILELATHDQDGAGNGSRETVRYEIVLPEPVDHPWNAKRPGEMDEWVVLPALRRVAVLPASALSGATDPDRDPLIRRYRSIIQWALIHRDLSDRLRAKEAADHLAGLRTRNARASPLPAEAEAEKRVARHVRALLGSLRDADDESETVAGRLSGKFGLLRRNGLGATAIRSGRAVLVGDPELDPEDVRIPGWMAQDLGIDADAESVEYSDVVIVNRQPTLHPYNLLALRAKIWEKDAVALHPILLKAIAGDFDGDTVAVHRLWSEDAREEIWQLRRPAAALRSGASGELLAKLDQDVDLGLAPSRGGKHISAVEFADDAIAGLPLGTEGERETALTMIVGLQRDGLRAAVDWGPSVIALDPSRAPGIAADLTALKDHAPDIHRGIVTKAAGTIDSPALHQWLISRGRVSDLVDGAPADADDEVGNYLDGIADEHYFAAAQPAILGIAKKKLITPFAGALTRSLVRRGYEVVITEPDCEEHDGTGEASVFDCRQIVGPCARAYGHNHETGLLVDVGDAVGIRAALFIGEKGTQKALKSIHRRSGDDPAKIVLRELSGILLSGRGEFSIPARFATLREGAATIAHKDLEARVRAHCFSESPADRAPAHEVIRTMGEVLVARFCEILDDVAGVHAAVLIRQRLIAEHGAAARPEGAPAGELSHSSALATAVWTGRLDHVVLTLGVPAAYDPATRRLVRSQPIADVERRESGARGPGERLSATIRNAHAGGRDE